MAAATPTVGWIGTGRMGYQLALRLLNVGYDVAAYNRTRAKCEPLTEFGAKIVDTPADLADRDIVFIMVSADKDLEAVISGQGGLLTGKDKPRIVVDSSTVSTEASARVRAIVEDAGAQFVAAPVSGNPKVIAAAKLTVAASGPRSAFDEVEPLLATWGRGVTYVGEGEVARLVKIAHNVFLGVVIQSLAEITVLAERGGVSRAAFLEFLNESVLGSAFTRYKSPALV
ncbi:MAG: NAD(P)-dependent oxidoreductase, partial [Trebonia sp.]